ncbi:OLC1v1023442C1 [Oldenlandia corymbosa var. corymbosa]|uniref:OLC1v1023442C1 n=1 Tax=Oldenlandia corymbosa var. corymbosa TaxID=529605 RepID=A0AAV1BZY0_OLDCO|nr:OLC1v1023442C1 [Oldenlandia corymbosa var. corymbosa]
MNQASKLNLLLLLVCSFAPSAIMCSRDLNLKSSNPEKPTLLNRMKLVEEGTSTCWESLFELQSCAGEIALFLMNGETYLGDSCCTAIRTIQHHCWPSMLGSVGIDGEESDVLLGYCDASEDEGSGSGSGSPPLLPIPPKSTSSYVINHP